MIHKFISNDNKGNVNTLEIGSDYTKISKVVDPVNDDDVANKKYVDQAAGKFIVTLTPTSPDYSGTMDKTVAEINAAYEAGQEIVFRTMMSATAHMDVDCTARWFHDTTYPSFNGFILNSDSDVLLFAFTGVTNDGTRQTYGTKIYPITPAS